MFGKDAFNWTRDVWLERQKVCIILQKAAAWYEYCFELKSKVMEVNSFSACIPQAKINQLKQTILSMGEIKTIIRFWQTRILWVQIE